VAAIAQLNGDKLTAARLLGIGKTTLDRKLKAHRCGEIPKAETDTANNQFSGR